MLSIPVFLCVTSYGNVVHRFSNLQLCVQWTSVIIFRLVSHKFRRLRIPPIVGYRVVYLQWLIAAGLSTAELRRSGLERSKLTVLHRGCKPILIGDRSCGVPLRPTKRFTWRTHSTFIYWSCIQCVVMVTAMRANVQSVLPLRLNSKFALQPVLSPHRGGFTCWLYVG
jgi:hypothetical protein